MLLFEKLWSCSNLCIPLGVLQCLLRILEDEFQPSCFVVVFQLEGHAVNDCLVIFHIYCEVSVHRDFCVCYSLSDFFFVFLPELPFGCLQPHRLSPRALYLLFQIMDSIFFPWYLACLQRIIYYHFLFKNYFLFLLPYMLPCRCLLLICFLLAASLIFFSHLLYC